MRKFLSLILAALVCAFAANAEVTIQGIPVTGKMAKAATKSIAYGAKAPDNASTFNFDSIKNWTGEGDNQAALVLQWDLDGATKSLVWGYRWAEGETKTGWDMIAAIAAADPRFFVQAYTSSYGQTINGFGYDADASGDNAYIYNGVTTAIDASGVIDNSASSGITLADAADWWNAGFSFSGYWSYNVGEDNNFGSLGYSSYAASGRTLKNGSIDAWKFGMNDWKDMVAADANKTNYTDGLFFLNEDWFGHNNGSINFFATDGTPTYNVHALANGGNDKVLGTSSCFGMVYGKNFYAVSKQGNRFVVMNAKTMEVKKSFTDILVGDGRAAAGINENKIYVGGSNGIAVYDIASESFTGTVSGFADRTQVGDIVRVGKYVFAALGYTGVAVIDPTTDAVVKTIDYASINGIAVTANGYAWAAAASSVLRIDPATLETKEVTLPGTLGSVWGAWKPTSLCANATENALYYITGGSWGQGGTVSKLDIAEDGTLTVNPDFNFTMPAADAENQTQQPYAALRIDPHTGYIILWTVQSGWGANYAVNWLHFINPATGAIVKTIRPVDAAPINSNYWFAELPVFPDTAMPAVTLSDVTVKNDPVSFAANEVLADADNLAALANVEITLDSDAEVAAEWTGNALTFTPKAKGSVKATVKINSNGKIAEKTIAVNVDYTSGINAATAEDAIAVYPSVVESSFCVKGAARGNAAIYNAAGAMVLTAEIAENGTIDASSLPAGAYIVRINTATATVAAKIIKK